MDRSRQMPNSNEQQSSSDDLIAELARLMAEEAQGAKPTANPTPAESADSDESKVVPMPSARPAADADPAPAGGSAWGRRDDRPAPANTDTAPESSETRPKSAEPVSFNPFGRDSAIDSERSAPTPQPIATDAGNKREPSPEKPDFLAAKPGIDKADAGREDSDAFAPSSKQTTVEPAPEPRNDSDALANDPIAELIAQQEREEARTSQLAGMPRHVFPDPTPAAPSAPAAPRASDPSPASVADEPARSAAEPAPIPVLVRAEPDTRGAPAVDPDVLSLLRSMNAENATRAPAKPKAGTDDAFSSPIFGAEPAKPARAAAATDPLEEIESLIGDAVRLSHEDQPRQPIVEKPVEPQVDVDDAAHRAEAAIAAATAASGRTGHRTQQPELHDPLLDTDGEFVAATPELDRDEVKPVKPPGGRLVIGAAAATILVAVGLGLFWVFGETGITDGTVPFLASNTGDAKAPVEQNTAGAETSQPAIFNEMDGNGGQTPANEQIVSRDQSTAGSDAVASSSATDTPTAGNTTTNVASAGESAAATGVRQVETPQAAEESLANRKVRTVTVRPDGTIVSNEDTLAANEVLPVVRPNVPALSGDNSAVTDFQVAATPDGSGAATNADTASAAPAAGDPLASLVSSSVAESDAAASGAELVTNAPYPAAAPSAAFRSASAVAGSQVRAATQVATAAPSSNTIDLISGAATQQAPQVPAATATAPASNTQASTAPVVAGPAGSEAPAYVQLSSQRSLDAANVTLASLGEKFRGLFNGAEPIIKQVDLGERGIYYRVLVPANSLADASGVCSSVKSAGGDCFVRNNN